MKNNPTWLNKFEKIGVKTDIATDSPIRDFYDPDKFERIKKLFQAQGIDVLES